MALKKTEIIPIDNKKLAPKVMFIEYPLVTHPTAESALELFEERTGKRPAKMWHYTGRDGKFQSWIIPLEDVKDA